MTHTCERCHRNTELFYCRSVDEHLCEQCLEHLSELTELLDYAESIGCDVVYYDGIKANDEQAALIREWLKSKGFSHPQFN